MDRARIDARFHAMDAAFDDACVSGWEPLVKGIVLPDPDDRHVVAAALRAHAGVIVTANVKDFPRETLEPLGLHVLSPDAFLLDHLELDPEGTITILVQQAADYRRPPVPASHVLNSLTKAGAPEFAAAAGALLRARSTRDEDDRPSG